MRSNSNVSFYMKRSIAVALWNLLITAQLYVLYTWRNVSFIYNPKELKQDPDYDLKILISRFRLM